jgi:hypothetical protein
MRIAYPHKHRPATPHDPVTVRYTTVNATAKAPADYASRSGTLYFGERARTKYINVPIVGDRLDEANEYFKVRLADPFRAEIADGLGVVTIVDNDALPRLRAGDPTPIFEENAGSRVLSFPIQLSVPSGRLVTVHYAITPGSASYGSDYVVEPTSGMRSFAAGVTTKYVPISVIGDLIDESDETVNLTLSTPVHARIAEQLGRDATRVQHAGRHHCRGDRLRLGRQQQQRHPHLLREGVRIRRSAEQLFAADRTVTARQ